MENRVSRQKLLILVMIILAMHCGGYAQDSSLPTAHIDNTSTGETPYRPSLQPTGYKPVGTPTVTVTGGVEMPVENDVLRLDADLWRVEFEDGKVRTATAKGNVRATYGIFSITCDSAAADMKARTAIFTGNVVFYVNGQEIKGESLQINIDTKEWRFEKAESRIDPSYFPQMIRAPIFLSGASITGVADKEVEVNGGGFTTCDLDHPHYYIKAGKVSIWPDRRLIAKDAVFFALGKTILKISRIAVPIRQLNNRQILLPNIGQNASEGLFLKTAYSIVATRHSTGNLKLDLMSQKGIGYGYEHIYNLKAGVGSFQIYMLDDRTLNTNSLSARFTHNQTIGSTKVSLLSDFRRHSFLYSPDSTSLANELRLVSIGRNSATSFGARYSIEEGYGTYKTLTSNLQHTARFGDSGLALINFDYFRSVNPVFSGGGSSDFVVSQLISRAEYQHTSQTFDWKIKASKISDFSAESFIGGGRFAGLEQLPEMELSTSSERLHIGFLQKLPLNMGITAGVYREDLGRVDTSRATFNLNMPSTILDLSDRLKLTASADFKQYFYGDGTAQYMIGTTVDLHRQIGSRSSAAISYRYLNPRGYTPFRFDYTGQYNVINGRLDIRETDRFKLSLYGGFNFGEKDYRWQDLALRTTFSPSDNLLIYASTAYDLNRSRWRALVSQIRLRPQNQLKLDIGSRYDLERHKFASVKTQLDTPVGKLWHIRANGGWNGYTNQFDYRNIQIVRDLHCWEMAITWTDQQGYWNNKGLSLNLRIKAFPIFDGFGIGQYGQPIDTSVGEIM